MRRDAAPWRAGRPPDSWHPIGGIGSNATSLVVINDSGLIVNVDVGRTLLSALRIGR